MAKSLLYESYIPVNDAINIYIPTVDEVIKNEDEYYSLIFILTASPVDMLVQLDEIGIDFTSINDYELFLLMFQSIKMQNTSLVFGDLDLSKFNLATKTDTQDVVLFNSENNIVIDRKVYATIGAILRKIHHLEKNRKKPANQEAKEYMLERAKAKLKRKNKHTGNSQLESLIVAMVNTEQYKYDFEGTRGLSIYQFNESVRQIIKKVDYDNRMIGVYSGTINAKELSRDDLSWLTHK